MFDVTWSTISQPTARSRRTRSSSSGATLTFDLCLSTSAPTVALAPAKVGQNSAVVSAASRSGRCNGSSGTRLGRIRPSGDDATSVGDGSTFFAANAAAEARCDSRSIAPCGGLVSDDCGSGFDVASLGRRRTSTVNEGAARLNLVLDTAHRSAHSSRRRRPCEAKRNKAIGGHCGDNGGPPDIRETDFRGAQSAIPPRLPGRPQRSTGYPRTHGQRFGERGRASTGPIRLKIAGRCCRIGTPRISSKSSKACARRGCLSNNRLAKTRGDPRRRPSRLFAHHGRDEAVRARPQHISAALICWPVPTPTQCAAKSSMIPALPFRKSARIAASFSGWRPTERLPLRLRALQPRLDALHYRCRGW